MKLHCVIERLDVGASDLSGSVFNDVNLSGAIFEDVNMSGWRVVNVNLAGLRLSKANLAGVSISDSRMSGMTIDGIPVADLLAAYEAMRKPPQEEAARLQPA